MKDLTFSDIEAMVRKDESRVLEVKKTTGELYPGMCSGCAFLNSDGGWLLFGVTPALRIVGQDVSDSTRQEIAREMRKFVPAIDLVAQYINVPESDGKKVIAIWFPAGGPTKAPYTYDGRPYYKIENTTAPMPLEMFEERIKIGNPKKFSWEKTSNDTFNSRMISSKTLTEVLDGGINKGRIPKSASSLRNTLARLDHFKLLDDAGNLTNAAIVLFGKDPSRVFGQCKVRLARFEGTTMNEFRDQTVCYGNLFEQYDAVVEFCQKHMYLAGKMELKGRIDTLTVPIDVVREAALNLLVHRTWWSDSRTPSVAIFDDRVEFMNPGAFPAGTTPEDFIKRPHSAPINPTIAEVFFKSGVMEGWGRGLLNIVTECKVAGLPSPEFETIPDFVSLTIRFKEPLKPHLSGESGDQNGPINGPINDPINDPINGVALEILHLIQANPGIKKAAIAQQIGKSETTVKRYVKMLADANLIEYKDSNKTGGYFAK